MRDRSSQGRNEKTAHVSERIEWRTADRVDEVNEKALTVVAKEDRAG